jgi:transcriptional regulator with XRE-family HTH domain
VSPTPAKTKDFGAAHRLLRKQADLTITNFAAALGVSASHVQGVENGSRQPYRPDVVRRAAQELSVREHVDPEAFVKLADSSRCPELTQGRPKGSKKRRTVVLPTDNPDVFRVSFGDARFDVEVTPEGEVIARSLPLELSVFAKCRAQILATQELLRGQ